MSSENQSKRKLAAILFADIVGYTSLMQKDETIALSKIKRYQQVLDTAANQFNGQVLKNYGDGSLMTFSNSLDAIKAAIQIQEQSKAHPNVPLRIGMHIGEFIVEKGDIYGNGVNLASRIESLGIEGAVLFSKNIYQKIKSLPEFEVKSLGHFEFKNVEEPMEVFALANEGFPIPERIEMQGKLKNSPATSDSGFLSRLWSKKIPQYFFGYLIIGWGIVQLMKWGLLQAGMSPHWSSMLYIALIGFIPSLLIYLFNRERIHSRRFTWKEKLIFPTNIVALGAILFFLFRSAELGAITQNITFLNADGIEESREVIKEEFRQYLPIFRFEQLQPDSLHTWYGPGITVGLAEDIGQNKYLSVSDKEDRDQTTIEKIEETKVQDGDFYVDGTYQMIDGILEITPKVRNSKNGNVVAERLFRGKDFFSLIDSMSIFIRSHVGLSPAQIEESIDLKLAEMNTNNLEAFRYYTKSKISRRFFNLEKAIELDSAFAYASLELALRGYFGSRGEMENIINLDRAMRHRKKLPFEMQIGALTMNHILNKDWDKAEKLLKMQLKVSPNDPQYNWFLQGTYLMSGQTEKVIKQAEERFAQEPNFDNGVMAMNAALMRGDPQTVISRIKPFLLLDPQNGFLQTFLANAYIHAGSYALATETIENLLLSSPDSEKPMSYISRAISYLQTQPTASDILTQYEGTFRNSASSHLSYLKLLSGQIFERGKNQFGEFMFPTGDSSIVKTYPDWSYEIKFLYNDSGDIYGTANHAYNTTRRNDFYTWKQDSLIWKAEAHLRNKEYDLANKAYDLAIEKHPEHFYLAMAQRHIEFVSALSQSELLELYQKHVGKYDIITLWVENDQLFLKQEGQSRRILLPISDQEFVTLSVYDIIFGFENKNGVVDIYQEYLYNHELKTFEKDEDWRREKEVLLN